MSPLFTQQRAGQEREALATRLRQYADKLDHLADAHTEVLDFEGYAGLTEHAAALRAVVRVLKDPDVCSVLRQMAEEAEGHLAFIEEYLDLKPSDHREGGAS